MEIPDHLRRLVDQLGEALVAALLRDPQARDLTLQLQQEGYELSLSLEASPAHPAEPGPEAESWSEEDKALLQTYRIALE